MKTPAFILWPGRTEEFFTRLLHHYDNPSSFPVLIKQKHKTMKQIISIASLAGLMAQAVFGADPALTIYNQDFAVVRDTVPLDLKSGVNNVRYADATARVEPDSVILRDPAGKHSLQIWEQNYRNDPVTPELLLSLFEGKTIPFEIIRMKDNTEERELISGKVIRSGFVPGGNPEQPIIEVNGKLQFRCRERRCFRIWATTPCSSRR
jgi:hypothetical protein